MKTTALKFTSLVAGLALSGSVAAQFTPPADGGDVTFNLTNNQGDVVERLLIRASHLADYINYTYELRDGAWNGPLIEDASGVVMLTGDLRINSWLGDNRIRVINVDLPGGLEVNGGGTTGGASNDGQDRLTFVGDVAIAGDLTTAQAGGDNDVTYQEDSHGRSSLTVGGDVTVETNNEVDSIEFNNLAAGGDVTIDTGGGADQISLMNSANPKARITGDLYISGGSEGDAIALEKIRVDGKGTFFGNTGMDTMSFANTRVHMRTVFNSGPDDDDMSIIKGKYFDTVKINCMQGENDALLVNSANYVAGAPIPKNCESLP